MSYVQMLACLMWIAVQTGSLRFTGLASLAIYLTLYIYDVSTSIPTILQLYHRGGITPLYNELLYINLMYNKGEGAPPPLLYIFCAGGILCYMQSFYVLCVHVFMSYVYVLACIMWIAVQTGSLRFAGLASLALRIYIYIYIYIYISNYI